MSERTRRDRLWAVLVILVVFGLATESHALLSLIPGYLGLYEAYPWYIIETFKSGLEVMLAVAAVLYLSRSGPGQALRDLGLRRPNLRLIGVCLAAVVPMWIVFGVTGSRNPEFALPDAVYLAGISPFAEELVFRGFAFRQLYRRVGLPFWLAVLLTSLVFGLGHVDAEFDVGQLIGVFGVTFAGGIFAAWLFVRWNDNLWAPFVLHATMNLAWQVFAVGESAFAGWLPTVMQATTLILAVALTLWVKRPSLYGATATPPSP